jgi:hypothetical protein
MSALRPWRIFGVLVGAFVVITAAAAGILSLTLSHDPVPVHVRWKPGTSDAERAALEQRFDLIEGAVTEGTTRAYLLADMSTANVSALVHHASVEDTAGINRTRFRPAFAHDRDRRLIFFSVLAGVLGAVAVLLTPGVSRATGLRRARP